MFPRQAKFKLALIIMFFVFLVVSSRVSSGEQGKSKKEIMVEMGKVYTAMDQRMLNGVNAVRFLDSDYADLTAQSVTLSRLANDYAKSEGKAELSEIAKSLAATVDYMKQQVERKDPIVTASTFGRLLSYCAECHYESRWTSGR